MKLLGEKKRSKLASESFSLSAKENKPRRLSNNSRQQTDPRYSATPASSEMYFTNTPMVMEGCTCRAYSSRPSLKQGATRGVKRDACTSPTYPPSSHHANTTIRGSFKAGGKDKNTKIILVV